MIEITNKKKCSGCTSCYAKCPTHAITMLEDEEGFKYPKINKEKCINCGLCEKVCPYIKEYKNNSFKEPLVYGGWSKEKEYRNRGTSGGVFSNIAEYIIKNKGVVCGAICDENLEVKHIIADNMNDVTKMNGSKYVQSDLNETFRKIKEYLEEGKKVLFTGTPCQVTGLLSFLEKDYENLITLDLVCHGVPSPKVYNKYKEFLENKNKSKLKEIKFRTKITGWKKYSTYARYENGREEIMYASENPYMRGFLKDIYLRPSCNNCISSKIPRNADITLGDFWGVENKYPDLDSYDGTSLVLVNSEKGKRVFEEIKKELNIEQCEIKYAIKDNPAINTSAKENEYREEFFKDLAKLSFDKLSKKYFPKVSLMKKICFKAKNKLVRLIKGEIHG